MRDKGADKLEIKLIFLSMLACMSPRTQGTAVMHHQGSDNAFSTPAASALGVHGSAKVSEMVEEEARNAIKTKKSAKSRKDAQKRSKSSSYTRRPINVSGSVIRQTDTQIAEKPPILATKYCYRYV